MDYTKLLDLTIWNLTEVKESIRGTKNQKDLDLVDRKKAERAAFILSVNKNISFTETDFFLKIARTCIRFSEKF